MSNKEFEKWFEELVKDRGFNLNITGDDVEKAWDHQQSKLDAKDEILKEAIRFIVIAKKRFRPDTTNSDVDYFLEKPEIKQLRGESNG